MSDLKKEATVFYTLLNINDYAGWGNIDVVKLSRQDQIGQNSSFFYIAVV